MGKLRTKQKNSFKHLVCLLFQHASNKITDIFKETSIITLIWSLHPELSKCWLLRLERLVSSSWEWLLRIIGFQPCVTLLCFSSLWLYCRVFAVRGSESLIFFSPHVYCVSFHYNFYFAARSKFILHKVHSR